MRLMMMFFQKLFKDFLRSTWQRSVSYLYINQSVMYVLFVFLYHSNFHFFFNYNDTLILIIVFFVYKFRLSEISELERQKGMDL